MIENHAADKWRELYNKSQARVASLETVLEKLLRCRPHGLGCSDFSHAKKDQHTDELDCPCQERWEANVESACNALKQPQ
jgi:hypothetical protein